MGSAPGEGKPEVQPQHRVRVTRPFFLGVYPVTQKQYEQVMGTTRAISRIQATMHLWNGSPGTDRRILATGSRTCLQKRLYAGVTACPEKLSGNTPAAPDSTTNYAFPGNEESLGEYAWYEANLRDRTHPVGQKLPNACLRYAWKRGGMVCRLLGRRLRCQRRRRPGRTRPGRTIFRFFARLARW